VGPAAEALGTARELAAESLVRLADDAETSLGAAREATRETG